MQISLYSVLFHNIPPPISANCEIRNILDFAMRKTTDFINPYCGLFTKISSSYHTNRHKKGGLILLQTALCCMQLAYALNFYYSTEKIRTHGNHCRSSSINIVLYTAITSLDRSINPVWNCQWTCFVSSCMLVYPNYTKSVLQNFTFWKIFLYNFFHYSSSVGRNLYFCDIHQKRKEPLPSNSSIMIPVSSNIIIILR